jgi:hypothetical protein
MRPVDSVAAFQLRSKASRDVGAIVQLDELQIHFPARRVGA